MAQTVNVSQTHANGGADPLVREGPPGPALLTFIFALNMLYTRRLRTIVMQNALLTKYINKNKREKEFPEFRPGDTIKVHVKIKEGEKERLQAFEGVLIARNGMGMGESITVRKVSFGQGVERIFPVQAPVVDHIDVVRTGRVRRAKLYYLRALKGKAARLKERE